jgi:hypothetical protein
LAANALTGAPEATLDRAGGMRLDYGGVRVITSDSLLLMDANWKTLDTPMREKPRLETSDGKFTASFESPLTTLTKTVRNLPDQTEITWRFTIKPESRGAYVELCLNLPAELLADWPPSAASHDLQKSDRELKLATAFGQFDLEVGGSTHPWSLDDLRKMAWSGTFRLRFAPAYDPATGCSATAILRLKATPSESSAYLSLPVASVGNRSLTDEQPADGLGGWTDQGENDLHSFTPGRQAFLGMPFTVGPAVAVLRGKERPAFPVQTQPLAVNARLARLAFLHTCAWSADFRQPIAEYVVTYDDAEVVRIPLRYGVEVNDWWGAREPLTARLAWSGHNGTAQVGLFLMTWQNPRPETPIKSLQCVSLDTVAVPVWLAATGIATGALSPAQLALLDRVFADRETGAVDPTGWFPCPLAWRDGITPGSALDLGFLNHVPAGIHGFLKINAGHFAWPDAAVTEPVRFWGTNAALHGPFPEKEDAPGIARCLARQGVNLCRLHLYAVYDQTLIAKDGSLDPVALDKWHFFIAQLKANGIYIYMDLNDGMLFDRLLGRAVEAPGKDLKLAALFNRELIEATQRFARMVFGAVNPYTGLRLVDDPAICLYEITNENSLTMGWGSFKSRLPEVYYAELAGLWRQWLAKQNLPDRPLPETPGEGDADSRRFSAEQQRAYLEEMKACLKDSGVKAPICGTNITFTTGDLWASENLDFTSDHAYWDHPNVSARPMTYSNGSAVRSPAWSLPMIPSFARAKVVGKPVVAGEWNFCFPNDYRCEGIPFMAAYSAFQDWDALLFYCATGSFDGGRWSRFRENPAILVHSQQTDPATWGLSQVGALLFRRGDVRPAPAAVELAYTPDQVWQNDTVLGKLPFLPALTRVETRLVAQRPASPLDGVLDRATMADRYAGTLAVLGATASDERCIRSSTGEVSRYAAAGLFLVNTPRSQVAVGNLPALADLGEGLADLHLSVQTRFATIAACSLDGRPLRESARILLVAVGNARNASTKATRGLLVEMGKAPVLAEPVVATVTLFRASPTALRVAALDPLTGERRQEVPSRPSADGAGLTFSIGGDYRTLYYELSVAP